MTSNTFQSTSDRAVLSEAPKSRVAFLVNGDPQSAAAFRARSLAAYLDSQCRITVAYRTGNKSAAIFRFFRFLCDKKPQITYVVDMAYSGMIAGFLYKLLFRNRLIVDTGDSIHALARSMGRSRLGLAATWLLESCSLHFSDQLVVRGTVHKERLLSQGIEAEVIQDGGETELFQPTDVTDLRRSYGLHDALTIGLVGSITWNSRLQMCYGSELVEALSLLRDIPVKGVIIGDGSGLERLKQDAVKCGVADKILFLGRIAYPELPQYLNLIDICLSTQSNDAVGQVRTTGKLPLYLATGRYILASRVGEAALVLPSEMLVDYNNVKDPQYPYRLALKIREAFRNRQAIQVTETSRQLAVQHFDYALLAGRLSVVLTTSLKTS